MTEKEIIESGKAEGYKERNDCTVISLARLLDMDYAKAHDILKYLGRKDGQGFNCTTMLEFLREYYEVKEVAKVTSIWILRHHAHRYPGRILVRCQDTKRWVGHAFAIVDGKITDNVQSHLTITGMWEIQDKPTIEKEKEQQNDDQEESISNR